MSQVKTTMKQFITDFLDLEGCDWIEKDGKLIISSEFQKERFDKEFGFAYPYMLTEYEHNHILNSTLSEFNNVLDREYGYYFECDYPGTFYVILQD